MSSVQVREVGKVKPASGDPKRTERTGMRHG